MNNGIKHSGLVLAGGVLLGWTSSMAMATDIIGVGNFGGFFRCDAVIRNGDNTVSIVDAISALSFDYGTEGAVSAVDVADGGSGYQLAGNLVFAGGDPLSSASGSFAIDGVPGTYQAELVTVVSGGTGYQIQTPGNADRIYTGQLVDAAGDPIDCTATDWAAGGGAGNEKGLILNTPSLNPGGDAGDVGDIVINPGLGYGDCADCAMTVFVDGVENPPGWSIRYTTDDNGAITLIDTTGASTIPDDPYVAPPTIVLVPATEDDGGGNPADVAEVNGTGFQVTDVFLWGSVSGVDAAQVNIGSGCADDAVDLEVTPGKELTLPPLELQLATWSVGAQGTGTVVRTTIIPGISQGVGYRSVPTVTGSTDDGATQAATFVARLGARGDLITLPDGTNPTIGPEWDVVTGGNFDRNQFSDLLLHNRETGAVVVWNRLSTGFWSPVEVGAAIGGWKIVGLVEDTAADGGGAIVWWNEITGRFAGWTLNTSESNPELDFYTFGLFTGGLSADWVAACTNHSLGTGDNVYWYNQNTGRSAVWNLEVDSSTDTFAITSAQYLTYGSTGTVALVSEAWEIVGVAAASGVATAVPGQQEACDVVWMNTADGRTGLWTCNPTANSQVDGLSYIESNGTEMQVASGYELVGIGQQFFSLAQYGTAPLGALTKDYWGATLVWNRSGRSSIWEMSTLLDQATWTATGPAADSGTGNIRNPNHVRAFVTY